MNVITEKKNSTWKLLSPGVGIFYPSFRKGNWIGPDMTIGKLHILNKTFSITVPKNVSGWAEKPKNMNKAYPISYGEVIITLTQDEREKERLGVDKKDKDNKNGSADTEQIVSPTDGVFYRKPHPDEPSYVNVGDTVNEGDILGLVEIMKCFNKISNPVPSKGIIKEILIDDAMEVKSGQTLFLIKRI
jgi:biotin carboxyl carrier protein